MMTLIERLRQHALPDPHDEREVLHAPLLKEAADLLESQAARIAELEAERDNFHMEYRMKCDVETKQLHEQLAALRRKIDETPVVAWMTKQNGWVRIAEGSTNPVDYDIPLISKEDLQNAR